MLPAFCWVLCDSVGSWDCEREEGTMRIRGLGRKLGVFEVGRSCVTDRVRIKCLLLVCGRK